MFRAGDFQRPRPGARGNHDLFALDEIVTDGDAPRASKTASASLQRYPALGKGCLKSGRYALDEAAFARDQPAPVKSDGAQLDFMDRCPRNLMHSLSGGHQDLFRHAAAQGTGTPDE